MADGTRVAVRYRTKDGWSVEVVNLACTPNHHDGEWLRVRNYGYFVADLQSVDALEDYVPLSALEDALAHWIALAVPA